VKDYIIAIGEYIHSEISSQLMGDLGNGYLSEGNFKKAEEFFRNALRINLRTKSLQGQSEQLNRLSCVYYRFGDLKKAIKFCKKSYTIGKAIDGYDIYLINKNLLFYYINKGLADFREKNYKKAIEANKYGLIYSIENHDIYHELLCLGNLSSLYLYAGKLKYSVAIALLILTKYSHINETDLSERKNIKQNISKAIINLAYIRKNLINFHNEVMKVVSKLNNTIRIATNQSYDLEFNEDIQILYQLLDKVPKKALRLEYASFKEDET
jgi:tetratricopeptide (TPR) repeat protein